MTLELELGILQASGDADQLGEVEDRHLVALSRRRLELLLPSVEGEMAERARRHHRVRPRRYRLLDRLDQLSERDVLARLDDRKAATFDLRGVVDRLATASLDDRFERPWPVGILEAEELRRTENLAPVKRRDLEALQALVSDFLQSFVAVSFCDQPKEVLHLHAARIARGTDRLEVVAHALAKRIVLLKLEVRLP